MSEPAAGLTTLLLQRQNASGQADEAGAVLQITLNRPQQRNAMSLAMVLELRQALAQAEADGQTRILVLRGADGHFCAGGDIGDMAAARQRLQEDPQALVHTNAAFGQLCLAYAQTPLALLVVVEGSCMGGGLGLACVADVTLASDTALFRLPETSLGLVPAQVGPFLVERLGFAEAKRLVVTGASLNAAEALALRLVHGVHAGSELSAAIGHQVQAVLRCAPQALAATKSLLARSRFQPPADLVQAAAEAFSSAALSPEGAEGTMAFLQKRKPAWAQMA